MTWVALGPVAAVGPGEIRSVATAAGDLVVWRSVDGRLAVGEARCPHQWSHLEAEGVVDGAELVCTAHFWRFDLAGHGTKVNIKGRRDEKADLRTYPVRERDGVIEADLPMG